MNINEITSTDGNATASHIIGFGGEYYTLWWVSAPYRHYYSDKAFEIRIDRTYIQNLSTDKETAIAKFSKRIPDETPTIDMDLRGDKWQFTTTVDRWAVKEQQRDSWMCPYYKFDMRKWDSEVTKRDGDVVWDENTDWFVKKLWRTFLTYKDMEKTEKNQDTMFHAQNSLVGLGLLKKFNGEFMSPNRIAGIRKAKQRAKLIQGHHGTNGERIEIELTLFDSFLFETQFGTCFVETYKDGDGHAYKYMGGNPPDMAKGDKKTVKGTIKHSEYKGTKETKLQRIKIQ